MTKQAFFDILNSRADYKWRLYIAKDNYLQPPPSFLVLSGDCNHGDERDDEDYREHCVYSQGTKNYDEEQSRLRTEKQKIKYDRWLDEWKTLVATMKKSPY